ncbi:hypothetical protein O7600_16515 [Micromonospora sp. WMMA1998]|uniref:hypothetical protein n=1 Tax=Micromonospora sp. WMMA1998 TaxID=3015167 RepID=UPI00248AAC65|nr:hypothetical protein [Micromonospora sp. WMMA1998]WBC12787.1 hypothetical protein O7600_16515 [Micromonospora sp. WMMA1998]
MAWEWAVPVVGTVMTGAVGIVSTISANRAGKRQERALERQASIQRSDNVRDKTREERKALYVRFLDVTARASDAARRLITTSDPPSRLKVEEEADLYLHESEVVGYEMSITASEDVIAECAIFESVLLRFRLAMTSIKLKGELQRRDVEEVMEVTSDLGLSRQRLLKAMRADLQFESSGES